MSDRAGNGALVELRESVNCVVYGSSQSVDRLRRILDRSPVTGCPACADGSVTGPNREHRRCGRCGGHGIIPKPEPPQESSS